MAKFNVGDKVLINGQLATLNGWPETDSGFFTWTAEVGNSTATGTDHTATTTVELAGAPEPVAEVPTAAAPNVEPPVAEAPVDPTVPVEANA